MLAATEVLWCTVGIYMYCTAAIWQAFKAFTWFLLLLLSPFKAKLERICSCCSCHLYFCMSFCWVCTWVCKEWKRTNKKDGDKLLSKTCTRGYGFKCKEVWFRLDMRKFFAMWMVKHWERLPREMLDAPSVEPLKSGWTELWGSWSVWRCPLSH